MLRALTLLGVVTALLTFGFVIAGCNDDNNIPDFSNLSILLYQDADDAETLFAQQALDNLGATYTVVTSPEELLTTAGGQAYDLLVIDNPSSSNSAMLDALEGYFDNGGRIAMSTWQSSPFPDHPLWTALGADIGAAPSSNVVPIYRWKPDRQVFTFPNDVPDFTALSDDLGYSVDYFPGDALSNANALGGVTTTPAAGQATIFLNDNKRSVLNSFLLVDAVDVIDTTIVPNDVDSDGKADAVEYWENMIVYLLDQPRVRPAEVPPTAGLTKEAAKHNK